MDLDYRLVLDSFADAVVASNGRNCISYVNEAAERLLGWKKEELLGKPLTVLMPPRMHAAHEGGFHRFIETHQARIIGKPVRVPALHRDGSEIDIELTLTAFRVGSGDVIVASLRDLRERVELERQLVSQRHIWAQYEVVNILSDSSTFEDAAPRVLRAISEALEWDVGLFWKANNNDLRLSPHAFWVAPSLDAEELIAASEGISFAPGEGLPGEAWQTRQPLWSLDAGKDPRYLRTDIAARQGLRGAFLFPVFCANEPHGVMEFLCKQPRGPDSDLLRTMASIGFHIGQFLERIKAEAELRKANEALKRERNNLHGLFVHAPAAIAVLRGPELRYELSNPINQQYSGGRELVGKTVLEALPELEAQGLKALVENVYHTGQPFVGKEVPVAIRQPDGPYRQMYLNGMYQPLLDESGQVNGVMAFAYDVTEQVVARRRAESLAQELRESEERFRALVENLPELAWSAQPDGQIDYYNSRWYEYTGTTFEEMRGWGWEKVHDPEMLPKVVERWKHSLETGKPFEMEFPLRGADGIFRWFLTRVRPLRDSEGRIHRWFGTNTNTDNQRQQAAALQEAIAVRDNFLSVAGHELRTPLAAMLLHIQSSERTLRKEAISPRIIERLEKASASAVRLEGLVNKLLDVSRIQAGRLALEFERVDLVALVREVVERHSEQALARGVTVNVDAPDKMVGFWDKTRLDQVVTNLLTNAIKYGDQKPVEVTVRRHAAEVVLRVADRGIGIAAEAQDRIFQKFERAARSTDYGGIGLGLWITRQVVEALGGHIEVRSSLGEGSTFTVVLPMESHGEAHAS